MCGTPVDVGVENTSDIEKGNDVNTSEQSSETKETATQETNLQPPFAEASEDGLNKKRSVNMGLVISIVAVVAFAAIVAVFAIRGHNKQLENQREKALVEQQSVESVTATEQPKQQHAIITKRGCFPFVVGASIHDIPFHGDYYDTITFKQIYGTLVGGEHYAEFTESEWTEYCDSYGDVDVDEYTYYGKCLAMNGNDIILSASFDQDDIITNLIIYSEELQLENGIHVGMSSETMASTYGASFLSTDNFQGEYTMWYSVNGLPDEIALMAENRGDIFDDNYPAEPKRGVKLCETDYGPVFKVPIDVVKDSYVKTIEVNNNRITWFYNPQNNDSEENTKKSYVVIDASQLRLRLGPSLDSDTYKWPDGTNRHPYIGERFPYLDESGDFYQIDFKGNKLWVSKQYTHVE